MYNQPQRAKRLYFDVIPRAVDEYIANVERAAHGRGRGRSWPTRPGTSMRGQRARTRRQPDLASRMLLNLASVVNAEDAGHPVGLHPPLQPGRHAETEPFLARLVEHAVAYYRDFVRAQETVPRARTRSSAAALADLAETLRGTGPPDTPAETIQNAVYEVGKRHPFPDAERLVRLPVSGAARPGGGPALRRVHRPLRRGADHRADRAKSLPAGGGGLTPLRRLLNICRPFWGYLLLAAIAFGLHGVLKKVGLAAIFAAFLDTPRSGM